MNRLLSRSRGLGFTFLALVASLLVPASGWAGPFSALIAASAAATAPNRPAPAPNPPGGVCDNCDGTGKLGDGTVAVTCPVCKGTGKSPPAPGATPVRPQGPLTRPYDGQLSPQGQWRWNEAAGEWQPVGQAPAGKRGYPTRGRWWSGCANWQHMTRGEHAGKYDHDWLKSLTWQELQSLHSDDHEGRVKQQYVVRPKPAVPKSTPAVSRITALAGGRWEERRVCDGKSCRTVLVFVPNSQGLQSLQEKVR